MSILKRERKYQKVANSSTSSLPADVDRGGGGGGGGEEYRVAEDTTEEISLGSSSKHGSVRVADDWASSRYCNYNHNLKTTDASSSSESSNFLSDREKSARIFSRSVEYLESNLKKSNQDDGDDYEIENDNESGGHSILQEIKVTVSLGWPCSLTNLLQNTLWLTSVVFAGHLGAKELDAVGLATMYANVSGISVCVGLATAMDTLCSQAYGAGNYLRVGYILQRAMLIIGVTMFLMWALWLNTEAILLWAGQDPVIANLAGSYCQILMLGLPFNLVYILLQKYMQCQGFVFAPMVAIGIINMVNIFLNWFLVYYCKMGFIGIPVAITICYVLLPVLPLAWMSYFPLPHRTWGGWTPEALHGWGQFFKLALPGLFMVCLEWWSWEICTLLAGMLGEKELGAQAVLLQVAAQLYMIPLGISIACSIRVGMFLGQGLPKRAEYASKVALGFAACVALCVSTLVTIFRKHIPGLYVTDEKVADLVSMILPFLCANQIAEAIQAVSSGVLRGCGRQNLGALFNFIGYYVLGMPVAAFLSLKTDLGIFGLWIGLMVGLFVQAAGFLYMILFRTDWKHFSHIAKTRAALDLSAAAKASGKGGVIPLDGASTDEMRRLADAGGDEDDDDDHIEIENENDPLSDNNSNYEGPDGLITKKETCIPMRSLNGSVKVLMEQKTYTKLKPEKSGNSSPRSSDVVDESKAPAKLIMKRVLTALPFVFIFLISVWLNFHGSGNDGIDGTVHKLTEEFNVPLPSNSSTLSSAASVAINN
eukprot:Nk52_evm5s612 gene=Nk52_evmTU5s612